jgi:thiol-disulfide isomerase/thioredoxin
MVVYPAVTAGRAVGVTRRAALALGLTGLVAGRAAAAGERPPQFETLRHQFTEVAPPRAVPPLRLLRPDGRSADVVAPPGKVLLVNFWATWCAACRTELPMLDRLQETAGAELQIAAISVDRDGRAKVPPYLRALGIRRLPVYLDPDGRVAHSDTENRNGAAFALYGMPITYVVDRSGRVAGYMSGAADWTSEAGRGLIAYFLRA